MLLKNKELIHCRDQRDYGVSTHSQYSTYSVTCHTVHTVYWFLIMCLEVSLISFIYSTSTVVIEIILSFIATSLSLCISVDKGL